MASPELDTFARPPSTVPPLLTRPRPAVKRVNVADSLHWTLMATAAALGLCALCGVYALVLEPSRADRVVLAGALLMPAAYLAATRSTLLLDWFFVLVVCNRLMRRLLDWGEGRFDELPLLSITPLAIAAMMLPLVFQRWSSFRRETKQGSLLLLAALVYAGAIGVRNGMGAVFAASDYVTPLLVLFWCIAMRPAPQTLARWLTVLVTLGLLSALYGIIQWAYVPVWDKQWVIWSRMFSSMGSPEPYQLSIAATLESRGPAAYFFAHAVAIAIVLPFTRRPWGYFAPLVCAFALLLTNARTGLVYAILTLLTATLLLRGKGRVQTILPMLGIAVCVVIAVRSFNQAAFIGDRVATLGDLSNDGSARGRIGIAQEGIVSVLTNPIGLGLGSGGMASRVDISATGAVGDNGYLELMSTLGIPGFALYASGLWLIVSPLWGRRSTSTSQDPVVNLGRAMLLAILPVLLVFNCLSGVHASYVWVLVSRGLAKPVIYRPEAP